MRDLDGHNSYQKLQHPRPRRSTAGRQATGRMPTVRLHVGQRSLTECGIVAIAIPWDIFLIIAARTSSYPTFRGLMNQTEQQLRVAESSVTPHLKWCGLKVRGATCSKSSVIRYPAPCLVERERDTDIL